jgi:hypothetical protein
MLHYMCVRLPRTLCDHDMSILSLIGTYLYVLGYTGKETMGLVPGHAYTLIAAKQSSSGHRLLKLRNPWGETEWTGAWCDDCPLWTDQMQVCPE